MFEGTTHPHKPSYRELLEKGIREFLIESGRVECIEQEILWQKAEVSIKSQQIIKLEAMKSQFKDIVIGNNGNNKLEEYREEKFQKSKENYLNGWNKNHLADINWERIVHVWEFKNKKEAVEWFKQRIEKETDGRDDHNKN